MALGALSAVVPLFDVLLGVVPGAAGVGHEDGHEDAGDQRAGQHPAQGLHAQKQPHRQGDDHRHDAGHQHLLEGGGGGDGDAGLVVRLALALHDAGDGAELPAHLLDHLIRRLGHALHRHGGKHEGQHAADQQADGDLVVQNVDAADADPHRLGIADEEGQGGQGGGADGKALAHGGGGVAHCVQLIGNVPHILRQAAHLGNAACVVGNRPVGVHGHGDAGGAQHPHGGQGDAIQSADPVGEVDAHADQQNGNHGRAHPHRHAADDGGGRAGLGLLGNALDRGVIPRGIDLRHDTDQQADDQSGDDRQGLMEAVEKQLAEHQRGGYHQPGGDIGAHLQGGVGVGIVPAPDEEGGDHAGADPAGGQHQGEDSPRPAEGARHADAQSQGGDQGPHIALKQVGAHAGHVTHVVAHVIGNHGGVPGVVLRDARLHLAHQVGAHVGRLGIDTAAHTGEQGDGAGPQGEAGQDLHIVGQDIDDRAAQQPQAHDAHAHDAAAGKGDGQRPVHAPCAGRVGRADIGLGGHVHAQVARADRKGRAHQEAQGGEPADEKADQNKQHCHKDDKDPILREQKRPGALGNGA